jgi:D-lactate dehydrogenase (cytochrome)
VPYFSPDEAAACHAAEERLIARAIAAGGTVSGEHGVGMGKVEHCFCEHGAAHMAVQAAVKHALDPRGIMNPGKLYYEPNGAHAAHAAAQAAQLQAAPARAKM